MLLRFLQIENLPIKHLRLAIMIGLFFLFLFWRCLAPQDCNYHPQMLPIICCRPLKGLTLMKSFFFAMIILQMNDTVITFLVGGFHTTGFSKCTGPLVIFRTHLQCLRYFNP